MPEPSREAREAAEALTKCDCTLFPATGTHTDSCARMRAARALDDFAEKWREEAERRNVAAGEASAKFLEEHRQRVKAEQERDALRRQVKGAINTINMSAVTDLTHAQDGTLRMAMQAHASGVDALRRRVSDLQRWVDHCECESLIDHVRDCLPEYEHDDNVHGESEPLNEIETIEEAGREIDALRRRVAELEAEVETERILVRAAQGAAQDMEARAEAAEKALAKYGEHAHDCPAGDPSSDAPCDCGLEEARRARGEG